MYLHLLLMLCVMALSPGVLVRLRKVRDGGFLPPVAAMVVWMVCAAVLGGWYEDTGTRLFHALRVALVLALGLMLTAAEARSAIAGFLVGAVLAAMIVAVHHVWGLPPWAIWASLLLSRNNFSSGNMISLATACAICFFLALGWHLSRSDRWLALAAAFALGLTVVFHALSRNSQLLLVILLMAAVLCRFRSLRASSAGMVAMLGLVAAMWHLSPTTQSRFAELVNNLQVAKSESNYGTSGGVRLRMYQEAFEGMVEHPILGTGVGSWLPHWRGVWKTVEDRVPPAARQQFSEINNPHNDFLLNGMETGVPGLLILVWLLGRFVVQGWQQRSTAGGVTVVMAVGLFVTAMVNAPFRDAALGMTLIWLLGASAAGHRKTSHA